jgi:PPOX class probable F420-dependent enzyme
VTSLDDARALLRLEHGLATVSTTRADGSIQSTVVNAGIIEHPVEGTEVAAFVARGGTRKIVHLRARPLAAVLWRAGWAWVAIEGRAELCGPDDPLPGVDAEGCRVLLRSIARGAGVEQEDWDEYDRLCATERRTAVLVTPRRLYRNP